MLIKFHLKNLNQASTSKSQPNTSILTKLKIKNIDQTWLQNLDQDLTSKPLENINNKMLNKIQLQNQFLIIKKLKIENESGRIATIDDVSIFPLS